MKKLSLVLALILVLTCGVLAACGDDTTDTSSAAESSKAATSSAAAESSEAADESSEAAAESSEAADESSDAAESSEAAPAGEITGDNVAPDATYTISDLYRQGGADVEWAYDPDAPISYPDEDGVSLNDGLLATAADFNDAAWIGFHGKTPSYADKGYHTITLDLGEAKAVTGVKVYVGTADLTGGIIAPSSIEVCTSEDGTTWTSAGTATPLNVTTEEGIATELVEIAFSANTQYVEVRVVSGESWAFVSEVEVYAE